MDLSAFKRLYSSPPAKALVADVRSCVLMSNVPCARREREREKKREDDGDSKKCELIVAYCFFSLCNQRYNKAAAGWRIGWGGLPLCQSRGVCPSQDPE